MLGGALGNITDRLRFGYVVDYLDIHVWPVFNLADTAIVIGAGLLVLALRGGPTTGPTRRPSGGGRTAPGPRG
jgi:signal peptidase II